MSEPNLEPLRWKLKRNIYATKNFYKKIFIQKLCININYYGNKNLKVSELI